MALKTISIIAAGPNGHQTSSEEANGIATDYFSSGVVGVTTSTNGVAPLTGNFAVNAQLTPDSTVIVSPGVGYVQVTPQGQGPQLLRIKLNGNENVTIQANSTGQTRYDYLYASVDPIKAASPGVNGDDVWTLYVSRATNNTTDDGAPPASGTLLAVITVPANFPSISNGAISDRRTGSGRKKLSVKRVNTITQQATNGATAYNGFNGNYNLSLVPGREYRIEISEENMYFNGSTGANNMGLNARINGSDIGRLANWLVPGPGLGGSYTGWCDFVPTSISNVLTIVFYEANSAATFTCESSGQYPCWLTVTELG